MTIETPDGIGESVAKFTFEDKDPLALDPNDEFESALIAMVLVQRKKKADYALDGDRWSNFKDTAVQVNITTLQAIDVLVAVKQSRLKALALNGRTPVNEGVIDTYLDRAVYSVLALAYIMGNE